MAISEQIFYVFYFIVDYNLFWGEASFDDRHCPLPFIVPGLGLREKRPGTGVCTETPVFTNYFNPPPSLAFHPDNVVLAGRLRSLADFFFHFQKSRSIEEQCNRVGWLTRVSFADRWLGRCEPPR